MSKDNLRVGFKPSICLLLTLPQIRFIQVYIDQAGIRFMQIDAHFTVLYKICKVARISKMIGISR